MKNKYKTINMVKDEIKAINKLRINKYKVIWNKLVRVIFEERQQTQIDIEKAKKENNFCDCIEYKGYLSIYTFLLKAMEELDGRKHHNIFTFKQEE